MPPHDWKPRLAETVLLRQQGDAYLFLRPEVPDWLVANRNAAALLSRCDGSRAAEELADEVANQTTMRREEALAFLARIRDENRLFTEPRPRTPPHRPGGLKNVHLNLTSACNLKCVYCYAEDRPAGIPGMTFEQHARLLRRLAAIKPGITLTFTGGEPTLNPRWQDIAALAKRLGFGLHLLTNAVALAPRDIAFAAEHFSTIKISIDGSGEATHDALRGAGSFKAAMASVEALTAEGANVLLAMTVTRRNIHDVPSAAARFGSRLGFAPLFRAGRAKFRPDLDITGREYYEALRSAEGVNPLDVLCSVLSGARLRPIRKCALGDAEISIGHDGAVYPCHLLHYEAFRAGNVLDSPLEAILESEALARCGRLTVDAVEQCANCAVRYLCGGSCRARIYHATGSLTGRDDFCEYEYAAFSDGFFRAYRL